MNRPLAHCDRDIPIFTNASMAADANGATLFLGYATSVCGRLSWANTNTPVGIFRLEVSNDGTNWDLRPGGDDEFTNVVDGSTATAASFNFVNMTWRYCRIIYDRTSGGSPNVTLNGTAVVMP